MNKNWFRNEARGMFAVFILPFILVLFVFIFFGYITHGTKDYAIEKALIDERIEVLRKKSYKELCNDFLDKYQHEEVIGPDGVEYQMDTQAFWDDKPNEVLRVMVSVDDGGWRAFFPLNDDFLIDKDNNFVDE